MNWKVLYVASRSEKKVLKRLAELGVMAYAPMRTERKKWSDRMKLVTTPLIKGYVFVKTDERNRDEVFKSQGVVSYVRYNKADAVVRDIEIEALKSIEEKGYYVEGHFNDVILQGQKVEIRYGPFKGLYGTVVVCDKEEEHTIQIEGIGYALRIKVPIEIIAKI
ncbi:MAG: UpxY family transcription antiterminator [Bacteroidia bacterium]